MSQYQPMYDTFQRETRERYVPSARLNVAASVQLPGSDLDPVTGMLKPDRVRRHRTQAQRLEQQRLEEEDRKLKESLAREMKKGGVRVTWLTAVVVCSALLFVCLFTIGYQRSMITACQAQINTLEKEIKSCTAKNELLTDELEAARDISHIGYAARNLGLIRSDAVEAVHLTAVDTRPLANVKTGYVIPQTIETTAQATHVPMLASAGN